MPGSRSPPPHHAHAHNDAHHDPAHAHAHDHPGPSTSFEDANRDHYNAETAQHYSNRPDAQRLAQKISAAMLQTGLFHEGRTRVMDFACGTGLISQRLAAHTKSIVGVDISPGMVDQYNDAVYNQGIPSDEMRAICVEELKQGELQLRGLSFDVIVCASSYHHFSSIENVTRTLVSYLNPGGSLLVADLIKETNAHDIFPENVHHIVAHRGGFSEGDVRAAFEGASLRNFGFCKVADAKHAGHPVSIFLARGEK